MSYRKGHRSENRKTRKFMISIKNSGVWLFLKGMEYERDISMQELIRCVIIPDWLEKHPEEREVEVSC